VLFELELGDAGLQHLLIAGFEEIATNLNRTHKMKFRIANNPSSATITIVVFYFFKNLIT
jgi:hypothetical protein